MMQKIRRLLTLLSLLMVTMIVQAQEGNPRTVIGETMRSNGRIYVVVAVMLTILIGLILYLVRLDKKISKAEKEVKRQKLIPIPPKTGQGLLQRKRCDDEKNI